MTTETVIYVSKSIPVIALTFVIAFLITGIFHVIAEWWSYDGKCWWHRTIEMFKEGGIKEIYGYYSDEINTTLVFIASMLILYPLVWGIIW